MPNRPPHQKNWILCLTLAVLPTLAVAQETPEEIFASVGGTPDTTPERMDDGAPDGTIVRIDRERVYFDVGSNKGLRIGASILVLRTINAKHPVTGKIFVDHFPLGTLVVDGVGQVLSFGRAERKIAPLVSIGDVVRIAPRTRAEPSSDEGKAYRAPAPTPAHASAEPVALELGRIFESTLGRTVEERMTILEAYQAGHPHGLYHAVLARELEQMRLISDALEKARRAIAATPIFATRPVAAAQTAPLDPQAAASLPQTLYENDPLEAAVYVANPGQLAAAFLYLRQPADLTFRRVSLFPDGDGYFRGRAPAGMVVPPRLDAFIEVVGTTGVTSALAGSAASPTHIVVEALPGGPTSPGPGHSAVRGFFEFVDFNRLRGNDYYLLAEGDFKYRIGGYLYSVSTGFGVLSGRGGRLADLDGSGDPAKQKGRDVGFNYAYLETELRFHRLFGMAARLLGGQAISGAGVGAELKMRIGNELGTNLVLGGSVLSDIGALGLLQLEWDVISGYPMSASVIVTNQPAQQEVGVRLVYQVSWRARSWIQPTVRVGYDVRNVQHGGPSLGLGLVMKW